MWLHKLLASNFLQYFYNGVDSRVLIRCQQPATSRSELSTFGGKYVKWGRESRKLPTALNYSTKPPTFTSWDLHTKINCLFPVYFLQYSPPVICLLHVPQDFITIPPIQFLLTLNIHVMYLRVEECWVHSPPANVARFETPTLMPFVG